MVLAPTRTCSGSAEVEEEVESGPTSEAEAQSLNDARDAKQSRTRHMSALPGNGERRPAERNDPAHVKACSHSCSHYPLPAHLMTVRLFAVRIFAP